MVLSLREFAEELRKPGVKAALQVRHAERPTIDPTDPSFGDALAITAEGQRTSEALGKLLAEFASEVSFASSPLKRTMMTCELIAKGMGIEKPEIESNGRLGNDTFYFANPAEVLEIFQPGNFFDACFEYYRVGELKGFRNLHVASDELEAFLLARLKSKLLVATTHDCYIAAYLADKAPMVFSRENWPRFLDGGVTFLYPDGSRRHALVRTGLSDGICGVGGKVM